MENIFYDSYRAVTTVEGATDREHFTNVTMGGNRVRWFQHRRGSTRNEPTATDNT